MPPPVSIIVLTRNEAANLPRLLASISWCDDIHLVDSNSTDATVEIAKAAGVQVSSNPFAGFGTQRNWALDHCAPRHDWILFLDADEAATPAFTAALGQTIAEAGPEIAGYYCCWKMMLDGVWLKRSDHFPKWQCRLVRKGRLRFENFGHGQKESEPQGEIGYLREPYEHYFLSKGWADWIDRHNRYSTLEAAERLHLKLNWGDLTSRDGPVRNRALKALVGHVPGWPFFRFLVPYILKGGFLEGRPGFEYCVNLGYYEYLIRIKMRELRQHHANRS